ncbi:HAMP domain-containing histidine kinase [Campylobacter lari]|uniref:ArsS family sensor histidine kinase n=1 Tax=Campylobacter lari TaxID=201 RepID=UPI00127FE192|nr:ArsS family sensor histidine kinase [Campylobacter lari]EAI1583327.1 sensor histidine kinase [Campylobacter lari]EAI4827868.1 HAMP domain-containing histidine kinase [Campylobacter lari]EAI7268697.1 HAMP domain-containing histidine kinase [Campylobacter lari]EAJ1118778.1 HAMP domain-containing histidine kinase [Campylobacter lari]EAK9947732.1 HAMP domain-containing histidine kinase [Campylobacter lari]
MNKSSIFYTITFVFLLASVSVILAFLWLIKYDQQNYTNELNAKYSFIANARLLYFNHVISEKEFYEQTKNYKMIELTTPSSIRKIIYKAETIARAQTSTGVVEIITLEDNVYLKIIFDGKLYLYKDLEYQGYRYFVIKLIASIVVMVLLILYIFIIRKLKPLRALKRQIDKFGENKLDEIQNVSKGEDEISQVATAFYESILRIQKLNTSRQFFLRNIMHELKTPITKGLITLEMLEDSKYKKRLVGAFNRLEILINEFAAIEQITSGTGLINLKKYNILDLLDEAKDIAMNDDENKIKTSIKESFSVNVDFKLFTTAMKNMIDNAIKYSDENIVTIIITKDYLCFKNQGKALDKDLKYYTQAFTQGKKNKDSFGLGLYIVKTILDAHKLKLFYEYKDGYNYFYFKNLENITLA